MVGDRLDYEKGNPACFAVSDADTAVSAVLPGS